MASVLKRGNDSSAGRGGARKRGPGGRADKDGDISMDARPRNTTNRIGKSSARGGANSRAGPNRSSRSGLNINRLQDEVDMRDASGQSASSKARPRNTNNPPRLAYVKLRVSGYKKSKASANADRGVGSLVAFLENKATANRQKALKAGRLAGNDVKVSIVNHHEESDDALTFNVPADIANTILRMDGWSFAGANLSIKKADRSREPTPEQNENTAKLRATFTSVLDRRYNAETKLLDLSALGQDPDLKALGLFNMGSETSAKVFPALMIHCDRIFKSAAEKREKINAVTLHSNELASLDNVKTLAHTFPDLKNLDLSNNKFAQLEDLRPWKTRFRKLDHLVVSGNPFELSAPEYHVEILKWFPSLRLLNGVQVRSDAEVTQAVTCSKEGIPVKPRAMLGDEDITNNFVSMFFPGFDADRSALVNAYYDKDSQFSFSVNTHAMRDPSLTESLTKQEWESYIRRSRNMKAINHLPARQARLFVGQEQIRGAFATIPPTKHAADPEKVHIECQTLPSVPDATGQYPQGVVGLLITVHGEYEEMDVSTGQATKRRSYDRSITLGPGLTETGLRVINDMMVVRAYGGSAAFQPDSTLSPEQDRLVLEFSKHTGMTLEYAKMCLIQSNWDPPTAVATFESAKATLPAEAFNAVAI
ncbi:hypothetical protein MPH_00264 [Macrophomina phaseolina MS6]|uniref:mRNA export factor MEX67 n=2 Tax=Macrophomina phaseolina TaxID=35725 RepID=K2SBU5_MACPH|nr:hypothetical protein MPH_00264 [Macrophomina phaseolina MS6]KAH7025552.1 hypothetical protein B0J12DRAFT_364972 [Macrophomina phaseolina]